MSLIISKCIEYDEVRKICIASENGKKYTLNNVSGYKIKKVKVDGCIVQEFGEHRCDFLFHAVGKESKAFFVELKGGAMVDAVKQLYDTIVYLNAEYKNCVINARIVGTADTPNIINSPHYKKLVRLLGAKGTIERATNRVFSENI